MLHFRTILLSALVIIWLYSWVSFAAQEYSIIPSGATRIVLSSGKYIYITNKSSQTGFVPYTYIDGASYACPQAGLNWAVWNISNINQPSITSSSTTVGPQRGIDISCGCKNPNFYTNTLPSSASVPNGRSGLLYDEEISPSGETCAQHSAILTCTNGNMGSSVGIVTGYIYPTCEDVVDPPEIVPSECVLKEFLEWVQAGTIDFSKVRNAAPWFIDNQTTTWSSSRGNFIPWYGIPTAVEAATVLWRRNPDDTYEDAIVSTPVSYVQFQYGANQPIYEFELRGVRLDTEGTNWWCLPNGRYRVNSNVYSIQQLSLANSYDNTVKFTNGFDTERFGGITWVNHWLIYGQRDNIDPSDAARYINNRFFGCKSELLPNPDRYCVEKLQPIFAKTKFTASLPTAVYVKEFTNNYRAWVPNPISSREGICQSFVGTNLPTFRTISVENVLADDGLVNMIVQRGNAGIDFEEDVFHDTIHRDQNLWVSPYRNGTGINAQYGTQIFGFWANDNGSADYTDPNANDRYYNRPAYYTTNPNPHRWYQAAGPIGFNTSSCTFGDWTESDCLYQSVNIPLTETGKYLVLSEMPIPDQKEFMRVINTGQWMPGSSQGDQNTTKLVCISHTCNPGYILTTNGCAMGWNAVCKSYSEQSYSQPATNTANGCTKWSYQDLSDVNSLWRRQCNSYDGWADVMCESPKVYAKASWTGVEFNWEANYCYAYKENGITALPAFNTGATPFNYFGCRIDSYTLKSFQSPWENMKYYCVSPSDNFRRTIRNVTRYQNGLWYCDADKVWYQWYVAPLLRDYFP